MIYDAVENTGRWPAFMEALCDTMSCRAGVLALHVPKQKHLAIGCLHMWTPEEVQLYGERYAHIDPWRMGGDNFSDGSVGSSQELCSDEEMEQSIAYREFYEPHNTHHGCGAIINRTEDGMSFLTLHRPKGTPHVSEPELATLRRLMPHLQRAVRLHGELSSLRSQLDGVRHVMDLYPQGFLQVDAHCRVIYANEAARTDANMTFESGQLRVGSMRGDTALQAAVHKMSTDVQGRVRRLDVARPAGQPSCRVLLVPVPKSPDVTTARNQPAVSILTIDMNSASKPDPGMLSELFSLTPAEGRFTSRLVSGQSVEEISTHIGITRETARTHLRRVLSKTNTRRQGELISLVLRSIPFPRV